MSENHHHPHHRHHGRHRGGGFWGRGGGDPTRGRKLRSEELQLVLLGLLEESPAHGYELMRALEARSGGFYAPSPGMIYPALAYLDDAGEIAAEAQGARKRYSLTPAGLQRLDADRELVAAIMEGLSRIGSRMEEVRDAFAGLHDLDPAAAHELHEARRKLKRALFAKRGCAPEEARRVAAVLTRAAAEIAAP